MVGKLASWVSNPERIDTLSDRMIRLLPQLMDAVDDDRVRRFVSGSLASKADHLNLGPLLAEALKMLAAEGRHQMLFDRLLHEADEYIMENEAHIRERVSENTAWFWRRLYMDDKVADNVILVLREAFGEVVQEPQHPLRVRLDNAIALVVSRLATSADYRKQISDHARQLLVHPALRDYVSEIWRDIRNSLREDAASDHPMLKSGLQDVMQTAIKALLRNEELRIRFNAWLHDIAVETVQSHQREVGLLIADTVRNWDTETVTRRVEQQVGEDLQYIRINGTLIGGLVGLTIYTVSRALA